MHALERDLLRHDDHVGVVEDRVGLGLVARLPVEDVVGGLALLVVADHRRVGVERAVRVVDDRQRLVLDVDQLERVARGVVVVGDDERDLLALEADLVGGEHGLRVGRQRRHPREPLRLEVLAGDHRADLRVLQRGGGVDRDDPRVRERAAQRGAVQHARQLDVVDVVALAADEARVLLALHPAEADRALVGDGHQALTSCGCSAAQRTDGDDVLVARAAADLAGDRDPDLVVGRVRVRVEQRAGGEHHARRAEAALQAVLLDEALLHRVELAVALRGPRRCAPRGPSAIAASIVHDFTGSPSTSTTQAPQFDVSQPQCVPVRPRWSRRKWTSSVRGSASAEAGAPLTVRLICTARPPQLASARSAARRRARWVSSRARWRL